VAVSTATQRSANRAAAPAHPPVTPPPLPLAQDEFRLLLLRGRKNLGDITYLVTACSWQDTGAIMTGDVSLQDPDPGAGKLSVSPQSILLGDMVELQARAANSAAFVEMWRMRVQQASTATAAGTRSWSLADDLQNLSDSTDSFRFVRDKKQHKHGWTADQVIRFVCQRYGIRIGALPRMSYRMKRMVQNDSSPLDVITEALRTERVHTAHRFVMRFRRGKLFITPLRRSSLMYEMGPTIIEGTLGLTKTEDFATVLTVRGAAHTEKGTDGKKHKVKKGRKIAVRVTSKKSSARFGVVHKTVTLSGIDSSAEARHRGLAEITKRLKPNRQFTFTHPGVLGIRRGQALRIRSRDAALAHVVWVTDVRHSLAPGDYTMEVTVTFSDPFSLTRADKLAVKKAAAAAKKRRKTKGKKSSPPKPRLRAVRS
jgi:hypothetical protein